MAEEQEGQEGVGVGKVTGVMEVVGGVIEGKGEKFWEEGVSMSSSKKFGLSLLESFVFSFWISFSFSSSSFCFCFLSLFFW